MVENLKHHFLNYSALLYYSEVKYTVNFSHIDLQKPRQEQLSDIELSEMRNLLFCKICKTFLSTVLLFATQIKLLSHAHAILLYSLVNEPFIQLILFGCSNLNSFPSSPHFIHSLSAPTFIPEINCELQRPVFYGRYRKLHTSILEISFS